MNTERHADLHELVQQYRADEGSLSRLYAIRSSATTRERFRRLIREWDERLDRLEFDGLGDAGKADYVLFKNHLAYESRKLQIDEARQTELRVALPFADDVIALEEARVRMTPIDPAQSAAVLTSLATRIGQVPEGADAPGAPELVKELREALARWFEYYNGYDPLFTWWCEAPYQAVEEAFECLEKGLSKPKEQIVGRAVGRDALMADLEFEMIPYTPEELIALGEREYAWCELEMKRASSELGYGDDWHAALEHVKQTYVAPGRQTQVIRDLALEAIEYVESRNLVTVPPLAKETWRMQMMSPEAQLVNPFFLGGEAIIVSYPTNTMTQAQKLMSMRGNNPNFSRATVQHELIPGHHLQGFMEERWRPYRQLFGTPFWVEGWALYWEMLLWDLGFPRTPEERIGMLFWRMHRCVRIVFSLRFHLGELTPQECVDMLVERVGHERANAEGEVRRSLNGLYPPLYQAAYMIGGLQLRALRRELVDSGRMTDREFHDAILHENNIPLAVLRAILTGEKLSKDAAPVWRFEGSTVRNHR